MTAVAPKTNLKICRYALLALLWILSPHKSFAQSTTPPPPRPLPTLEGHWAGTLKAGDAAIHMILHLTKTPDGQLHAKLDSLDQAVYGIDASALKNTDTTLSFEVPNAGASFEGKLTPTHQALEGLRVNRHRTTLHRL